MKYKNPKSRFDKFFILFILIFSNGLSMFIFPFIIVITDFSPYVLISLFVTILFLMIVGLNSIFYPFYKAWKNKK